MMLFQRSNSLFAKRKQATISNGRLQEVAADHYEVGLRTIALTGVPLTETMHGGPIVARLARGDSVLVVETTDRSGSSGVPFLVQTRDGTRGWAHLSMMQCFVQVLRGICFLGD
jgi:hypothetical protein